METAAICGFAVDRPAAVAMMSRACPPPPSGPSRPVLSPFVDHRSIVAWDAKELSVIMAALRGELSQRRLAYRVEPEVAALFDVIHLHLGLERRMLRNTPRRMW